MIDRMEPLVSHRDNRHRVPRACCATVACLLPAAILFSGCAPRDEVVVGSKAFTESVLLGEMLTQLAIDAGKPARHDRQLGGTQIVWTALQTGEIDLYVDYTGTITEELLKDGSLHSNEDIREALAAHQIGISRPLGFNNTYALGMMDEPVSAEADFPGRDAIRTISDLKEFDQIRLGFGNEFLNRSDTWPGLKATYDLPQTPGAIDHDLAYRALESGDLDVIDLYTTDAEIAEYNLRILRDDKNYFPDYDAVVLYRLDLKQRAPEVIESVRRLEGALDESEMTRLNGRVKIDQIPEEQVAAEFLNSEFGLAVTFEKPDRFADIWRYTKAHLFLVGVSMLMAISIAIPLGVVAAKWPFLGQMVLGTTGVVQTIPSLALLAILIPLFGLGPPLAICALFLYSLLPIVRNTCTGLTAIPREIHESAQALGLSSWARLRLIELPMAAQSILAGIKTAAVINIGTATLAGFVNGGGYGEPIITGLRLNRTDLLLEGAIPAALMALAAQMLFDLAEKFLVSKGLQLTAEN